MVITLQERRFRAFTVMELLVIITILVILFGIFGMSGTPHTGPKVYRLNCVNNLKQVGLAFRLWSGDNGDIFPMQSYTNGDGTMMFADAINSFRYFQVMTNELNTPKLLICPADKERTAATNFVTGFSNTNLSYFLGVDATETEPSFWLAGDRNLAKNGIPVGTGLVEMKSTSTVGWTEKMHRFCGNVAFADGSVQELSQAAVNKAFGATRTNVNRLAVP